MIIKDKDDIEEVVIIILNTHSIIYSSLDIFLFKIGVII